MPNRHVQVSLINSANAFGQNRHIGLRIEERLSGEVLADIDMTPDEFAGLLSGLSTTLVGFVTNHPERLGKAQKVDSLAITAEMLRSVPRAEQETQALEIAKAHLMNNLPFGTTLRYLNRTNMGGYRATFDRWEEPTEDDLTRARGIRPE